MSQFPSRPPRRRYPAPTQIREVCLVGDSDRRYIHAAVRVDQQPELKRRVDRSGSSAVARP